MIADTNTAGGTRTPLATIETLCSGYDAECAKLEEQIRALEKDLTEVRDRHMTRLKRQAGVVAAREAELLSTVAENPDVFERPRTLTIHGCKVGFTVCDGRVVWDDEETVLGLIHKRLPDQEDVLVRTTKAVNKDAVKQLPAVELARIGCRIEGAGDVPLVKRVGGEVEKLVRRLTDKMVEAMVGG